MRETDVARDESYTHFLLNMPFEIRLYIEFEQECSKLLVAWKSLPQEIGTS